MVHVDKNLYQGNMRKYPDGRISIQNTTAKLNFDKGENDLLIGVANDFYGWGLMARLENTNHIAETDQVKSIVGLAEDTNQLDLVPYSGTNTNADLPFKLTFSKKGQVLIAQITGQEAIPLQALGNHAFLYAPYSAVFAFNLANHTVKLKQGADQKEFTKE